MRKFLALAALLVALGGLTPVPALACSCLEQPFETAHAAAAAIFEARATSIEAQPDGRLVVTFAVTQTWRAAEHEHVQVVTAANEAGCGYTFEVGTSYLVYAGGAEGERYLVSLCSRTAPMAASDGDRALLGSGVVPVDIVDEAEPEERHAADPPTHAGCASCSAGASRASRRGWLALLGLAAALCARRSRS